MTSFRTNRADGLMVYAWKPIDRLAASVNVMASFDDDTIGVSLPPRKALRFAGSVLAAAIEAALINAHVLSDRTR